MAESTPSFDWNFNLMKSALGRNTLWHNPTAFGRIFGLLNKKEEKMVPPIFFFVAIQALRKGKKMMLPPKKLFLVASQGFLKRKAAARVIFIATFIGIFNDLT